MAKPTKHRQRIKALGSGAKTASSRTERTRQKLLEAGKSSFLARGVIDTTMEEVARAAGVSAMTVYRHFGTKEDLLAGVVANFCDGFFDYDFRSATEGKPLHEALKNFSHRYFDIVFDPETIELNRIVIGESRRAERLGPLYFERGPTATLDFLTEFLAPFAKRGCLTLSDPRRAAENFCLILRGYAHQRLLLGIERRIPKRTLQRQIDEAVALIVKSTAGS